MGALGKPFALSVQFLKFRVALCRYADEKESHTGSNDGDDGDGIAAADDGSAPAKDKRHHWHLYPYRVGTSVVPFFGFSDRAKIHVGVKTESEPEPVQSWRGRGGCRVQEK